MQKALFELTEGELKQWLKAEAERRQARGEGLPPITEPFRLSPNVHDVWNLYDYGDFYRLVYIRAGRKEKTAEKGKRKNDSAMSQKADSENGERLAQSINRAKARLFELAMCNEFCFFCTFTQDKEKRDRFDLGDFRKDFAQYVRNLNRKRPPKRKIRYLLIPEQHKDGAWHMHGLLAGLTVDDLRAFTLAEKLPNRIRKLLKAGKAVYNWEGYASRFGYFTCTEIESRKGCARYCTKYITKALAETARERGDHLFFASQGLKGRTTIAYHCAERPPFDDGWDYENKYVKVKDFVVTKCDNKI